MEFPTMTLSTMLVRGLLIISLGGVYACGGSGNSEKNPGGASSSIVSTPVSSSASSASSSSRAQSSSAASHAARLSWTPPALTEAGTPLRHLAGYRIYYGNESGLYDRVINLDDPDAREYRFAQGSLAPGLWHFAVAAVDEDNNESRFAGSVQKQIP